MLESIDADLARCLSIINSGAKILRYSKDFDSALTFYAHDDQAYFNASITLFTNIGEQANKLSIELKSKYMDLDWDLMISFRNRIVHEYHGIDIWIVFGIIQDEIPSLIQSIYEIINTEIACNNFNKEDLHVLMNDQYYNYVDFSKFKS